MFKSLLSMDVILTGDVGSWCHSQREEVCLLGTLNGQIFLTHPPNGRLTIRNIILQVRHS